MTNAMQAKQRPFRGHKAKHFRFETDEDGRDSMVGNMPNLASMTKATMTSLAKREYGVELDPGMKAAEMREKLTALVNGARG